MVAWEAADAHEPQRHGMLQVDHHATTPQHMPAVKLAPFLLAGWVKKEGGRQGRQGRWWVMGGGQVGAWADPHAGRGGGGGGSDKDEMSDMYSVGCMMWEMWMKREGVAGRGGGGGGAGWGGGHGWVVVGWGGVDCWAHDRLGSWLQCNTHNTQHTHGTCRHPTKPCCAVWLCVAWRVAEQEAESRPGWVWWRRHATHGSAWRHCGMTALAIGGK